MTGVVAMFPALSMEARAWIPVRDCRFNIIYLLKKSAFLIAMYRISDLSHMYGR